MPAQNVFPFPVTGPAFTVRAESDGRGVIDIRGTIGLEKMWQEEYGIEAGGTVADFEKEIKALGPVREIELNIYSYGGEVFAALAMHNILARHPARVIANVDGLAASAASVIIMAADEIRMPENAYLMIHNAATVAAGDYREFAAVAESLKKWSRDLANIYTSRIEDNTGAPRAGILADVIDKMDAETWLTGAEAKALGLIETLTGRVDLAACAAGALPAPVMGGLTRERVPLALRDVLFDSREKASASPTMSTETISAPAATDAPAAITEPVTPVAEVPPTAPAAEVVEVVAPAESAAPVTVTVPATEPVPVNVPVAAALTLEQITASMTSVVTAAVQPLADRLSATEAALANEQALRASGVPMNAWGNQRPTEVAESGDVKPDYASLTAHQKMALGRKNLHPGAFAK